MTMTDSILWSLSADGGDANSVMAWLSSFRTAATPDEMISTEEGAKAKLAMLHEAPRAVTLLVGPRAASEWGVTRARLPAYATLVLVGENHRSGATFERPRALRLVAAVLTRLAHDIRAHLSLVTGSMRAIEDEFGERFDPRQKTLIGLANRGVRRLTRLASNLAVVAAAETGRVDRTEGRFAVAEIVRRALASAQELEGRRNLAVDVDADERVGEHEGDAEQLEHALRELLLNALKNARSKVRVSVERSKSELTFAVADDGPGLPAERSKFPFERFLVVDGKPLAGIGLSIARDVAHAHGGQLTTAEGGPGATLVMRLPLKPRRSEPPATTA